MTKAGEELSVHREQEQIGRSVGRIMGGNDSVDQDARDEAARAHGRIDTIAILLEHQSAATERVQRTLDDMAKHMIGAIPAGIIAFMAGLVGWLANRAFPFH